MVVIYKCIYCNFIFSKDNDLHELLINILWDAVVHSSPTVRSYSAILLKVRDLVVVIPILMNIQFNSIVYELLGYC